MQFGRPAVCPSCKPSFYFGSLLGYKLPRHSVAIRKWDMCPNCGTKLADPGLHVSAQVTTIRTNVQGDGSEQEDG